MHAILTTVFWLSVLFFGFVMYYISRYQKVIDWAIAEVAPVELTKAELDIYRASISPRLYLKVINMQLTLPILVLALGTTLHWYLGVVGVLVSAVVVLGVFSRVNPGSVDVYLLKIILDLENRSADFNLKGDPERSEAAHDTADALKELYEVTRGKGHRIPSYGKIQIHPLK